MPSSSTTYFTFTVLTERTIGSVDLYGSWDNFKNPFKMERDNRCGRGHWKGCPTDIICETSSETPDGPRTTREAGLKMGATYWYYYVLNSDIESHNAKEPSTTSCPLLPDKRVNVLDVPILLPAAPDDQRGDFTGRKFVGNEQSKPGQMTRQKRDGRGIQVNHRDHRTEWPRRPLTAPARLPGGNIRKQGASTEEKNDTQQPVEGTAQHPEHGFDSGPQRRGLKAEAQHVPPKSVHKTTSKPVRLRTAIAEMRPIKTVLVHGKSRAAQDEGRGKDKKHHHLRKRSASPPTKKKGHGHGATRAKIHEMFDCEDGKGVKQLAHRLKKSSQSHQEDGEPEKHKHFHLKHGHLRRKLEHLKETKHSAAAKRKVSRSQQPTHAADDVQTSTSDNHDVEGGDHKQQQSCVCVSRTVPSRPPSGDKQCLSPEGMMSPESLTSTSTAEQDQEFLLPLELAHSEHQPYRLHVYDHASCLQPHKTAVNSSQETVGPTAAVRKHQDLHVNARTCALENDVPFEASEGEDISQRGPLVTPLKV